MDLRSGCPYWLVHNGLPHTYPALDRDLACEVAVVGGGITGALIGWHLIQAGISTVLLDRREVGWGSTAASTALLQYEIDTPLVKLADMLGQDHAVRAYQACRQAIGKIENLTRTLSEDCHFRRVPSLFLAKKKSDLGFMRREYEARLAAGFDLQWWDRKELREHMGFDRPCALISEDGGQVDPYRLAHALLHHGSQAGLQVHDRTEVTRHEVKRGHVHLHTQRGCRVKARHVVFATGYEVKEITRRRLMSLHSTYAFVTEPLPAGAEPLWHRNALIWEHADPYLYLRTTDDRRVIIGGEDEEFQDPEKRDALLPSKVRALHRKLKHLFPDLPFEVAFCWTGTFAETPDGLAYIGQMPGFERAYFSLGFGGNGITYSVLAAEIIRDAVTGRVHPFHDLFRFGRKPRGT